MHNIQNLLNQVGIIVKKNNEILDATGGRFNVFNIIGLASDEVRLHSALLAELLRPNGSHGLKDEFLKEFVKQLNIEEFDCESASVKVEMAIGNLTDVEGGRIDIVIVDKNNYAIIIENKIYAGDQNAQLIRYDNYAKANHFGKYIILYLTLNGHDASEESAGKDLQYTSISYVVDILKWLETCLSSSVRLPLVRETINQYITLIKQLTNQDMNTINKEEVVNTILSTPANLDAAFSIIENLSAIKDKIISDYFNIQLNEIAKELGLKTSPLLERKKNACFLFNVSSWNYFDICFEFDGGELSQLGYFYRLRDQSKSAPAETTEKLFPIFKRHNSNKSVPCGWTYMTKYCNWDNNAFKAIISGEMKIEIKNVVSNLLEQSKGLEM